MNSLREIARFIGMEELDASMRGVPNFVPVLNASERISMRAMISALEGLPQITLEAEAENTDGQVPLQTTITVHGNPGVVHSTTGIVTLNGRVVGGPSVLQNQLSTTQFNAVAPGQYIFNITRIGVSNTGLTTLQKTFTINAFAQPQHIPPSPPNISVSSTGSSFVVTGSGFLPNANVRVRIVEGSGLGPPAHPDVNQSTDAQGRLNVTFTVTCNAPDTPGDVLHFSATDGRPNPADLTGFLFSNTVDRPCP
jgi:hypothetical protein